LQVKFKEIWDFIKNYVAEKLYTNKLFVSKFTVFTGFGLMYKSSIIFAIEGAGYKF